MESRLLTLDTEATLYVSFLIGKIVKRRRLEQ